jgi:hypothetical protein
MEVARFDDPLATVTFMTPTFLNNASVGTSQQEQQTKQLFHSTLTVEYHPFRITGWVEQLAGHGQ